MPTRAEAEQVAALYLAYDQTIKALREQVAALVAEAWSVLTSWRDADADVFVGQVVPVVVGGQQQMSAFTAAYLAQQRAAVLGGSSRPAAVRPRDVTGAASRNGTALEQVYRRPFQEVWTDLANGKPLGEAVGHGLDRATKGAVTDLQRTKTLTAREVMTADTRVVGYRRRLTGDQSCALCFLASTQRYKKEDLMPLHPGCDCQPVAIYGTEDVGHVLDRELVEATHEAIAERFGTADRGGRAIDYRKLLLTREHGELGPILTVSGHNWTGPQALKSKLDLEGLPSSR